MIIRSLSLLGFRNLKEQNIIFHPKCNVFYGENASGKTSLLEAIYYLSHFRSFRQRDYTKIIHEECDFFRLVTRCYTDLTDHIIGIESNQEAQIVRLDAQPLKSRAILAKMLPCLYLDPETGKLITDSPKYRRQYMDWNLFHSDTNYLHIWQSYEKALKHRNAILKQRTQINLLNSYDELLSKHGEEITQRREQLIQQIAPRVTSLLSALIQKPFEWTLEYKKGFSQDTLITELQNNRERDIVLGYTRAGAHRGDFVLKANHKNINEYLSRGQTKLASIALVLAQIQLFQEINPEQTLILLIDDISAELDKAHRELLLQEVLNLNAQLFITNLEEKEFPELSKNNKIEDVNHYKIDTGLVQKMV